MPFAFTEHGVAMLASILNSEKAVNMSVSIIRAFIAMKQMALQYKELAEQLTKLETETKKQFKDIYEALNYLLQKKHRPAHKSRIKRAYLERKLSPVPLDDELCGQTEGEE